MNIRLNGGARGVPGILGTLLWLGVLSCFFAYPAILEP